MTESRTDIRRIAVHSFARHPAGVTAERRNKRQRSPLLCGDYTEMARCRHAPNGVIWRVVADPGAGARPTLPRHGRGCPKNDPAR
jgi:hypothetical protein